MKIFLSYASEDRKQSEEIAIALQKQGHVVFFDRHVLKGGEDYIQMIETHIQKASFFIFLISPYALDPGSFTLSELRLAQQKWPNPESRVLPVVLSKTEMDTIPAYLRAVTFFEAQGNLTAELATYIGKARPRRLWMVIASLIFVFALSLLIPQVRNLIFNGEKSYTSQISPSDYVTRFIFAPEDLEQREEILDPNTRFPDEGKDVVRLQRLSFGIVGDTAAAWSISVGVENTMTTPINLDISPRFFSLEDDLGRDAELLYFCCSSTSDILSSGETRQIQLIYKSHPGWEGKELAADFIYFRIEGLLPMVRGVWEFRPMATAD